MSAEDRSSKLEGDTFKEWFRHLTTAYITRVGMGPDDLGDAPWHDYYDDEMTPLDAMAHALVDWQDEGGFLDLDELGLGGRV